MTTFQFPLALFRESTGAITFAVKITPRSSTNEIVGVEGDSIKIRLQAAPVEGKANDALIEFLAKTLEVTRAQVEIVTGHSSRRKVVRVRGVGLNQVRERLGLFYARERR